MNAQQFIKDHGLEKARDVVAASANALVKCKDYSRFHVNDLKRLVESVDLVEVCGGLVEAKKKMNSESLRSATIEYVLHKAIHDHESIYGGEYETKN